LLLEVVVVDDVVDGAELVVVLGIVGIGGIVAEGLAVRFAVLMLELLVLLVTLEEVEELSLIRKYAAMPPPISRTAARAIIRGSLLLLPAAAAPYCGAYCCWPYGGGC
jgi:hypothetical protein